MATPKDYLPSCDVANIQTLLASLEYPECRSITPLEVTAEYHKIWILEFASGASLPLARYTRSDQPGLPLSSSSSSPASAPAPAPAISQQLILRVAGSHIPRIKTDNEVAILIWLRRCTSVPVPEILHFDSTTDNPLGCEYMLMTRSPGITASDVYGEIPEDKMDGILMQLATWHLELFRRPFQHLGGLRPDGNVFGTDTRAGVEATDQNIAPGPCVEEILWHTPDIAKFWPDGETYETLNPTSPNGYGSYTEWISAFVTKYVHALRIHETFSWVGEQGISHLEDFLTLLQGDADLAAELNDVPLRLAHRDLHFAQILIDPVTYQVTGVLDWEFAQIVPMPLWRRSFLWSGNPNSPYSEREALYRRWETIVRGRQDGKEMLAAARWKSKKQEAAWNVCNYLRCVVEVCPRRQQEKDSRNWWGVVRTNLKTFEIGGESRE